jgi:membrane protease subunit HflK
MRAALSGLAALAIAAAVAVWAWAGLLEIQPDEQAVVLRLGRYHRTLGPGLRWHALGVERVERRRVTPTLEEEFGYRTVSAGPPPQYEERPDERRMLSGDANVVDVEFAVQYRIVDLRAFLFGLTDPRAVVRDAAQGVMREVVAERPIDDVLTAVKGPIEQEAQRRLQDRLDGYGAGLAVQSVRLQDVEPPDPVKEAFADVTGAEQDRERQILDAQGYADEVVPRARGEARALVAESEGYREQRVSQARGESQRFTALLEEYRKAPEVTRERLSLETLEQVLPKMEKVIIEEGQSEKLLPYLPLGRRGAAQ